MRTLNLNNAEDKKMAMAMLNGLVGEVEFALKTEVKIRAPKRNADLMARLGIEKIFKTKETYRKGIFGRRYETAVNSERLMEGKEMDFSSSAPNGKEFIEGSAVLLRGNTDNTAGTEYIAYQVVGDSSNEDVYTDQNGRILNKADIEELLPKTYKSQKQGLENDVLWNTAKLESVNKIKVGGNVIKFIHG